MAEDPYKTLGVARDATEKQIRAAYLKIAKTSHPDVNPGDKKAEERFKTASAAHDLLSDSDKRARFDRGEIDGTGQDMPPRGRSSGGRPGPFSDDELGDILSGMFAGRGRDRQPRRGEDRRYTLQVSFVEGAAGATQRLALPTGETVDVQVPPGTEDGQVLRLRGKGDPGTPPGDALITIGVSPHPFFRRENRDIHLDLPVTVAEAVLGARVTVPTLGGSVTMAVPAGSDAGTRLRLRGKGIPATGKLPAGDLYATLRIVIGPANEALRAFLADWHGEVFDPRAAMTGP